MPPILTIILVVVAVIIVFGLLTYNSIIKLIVRVDEAWSDITVQLKYRIDLIPNLVNTVKGYAKHESEVFEKVTQARAQMADAKGVKDTADADNMMSGALKSLFAVAEAYPELKANQNFMQLQEQLQDTEHKIQASRRFYNAGVRDYNTKIQMFPANLVAAIFSFKVREFFEVADRAAIEDAPEVDFDK